MSDPSSRMLRLLSLLQTHRFWPGEELAGRLEVSPRTLRRDIDRLRELGYTVHSTRGAAGGYRLEAGSDLPPLLLDDDEAVAIAVGMRTAATASVAGIEETAVRALVKLEQILPAPLRRQVNALQTYTVPLTRGGGPAVDPDVLTKIAQACRDQERLQFEYTPRDREPDTRSVEPHSLVSVGRRWYLVAWDVRRAAWRTFRVDRLNEPRTSGARFNPRELPAADAAAYVQQSLASTPRQYEASVTLHVPLERATHELRWFGITDAGALDASSCRVTLASDSIGWLATGILLLECPFEVHGPPELVDWMARTAARLAGALGTAA